MILHNISTYMPHVKTTAVKKVLKYKAPPKNIYKTKHVERPELKQIIPDFDKDRDKVLAVLEEYDYLWK